MPHVVVEQSDSNPVLVTKSSTVAGNDVINQQVSANKFTMNFILGLVKE